MRATAVPADLGGALRLADREGLRIYLLGATPRVLAKASTTITCCWPGLVLCGSRSGAFAAGESADVAAGIVQARPDMLLVEVSTPKDETFLSRYAGLLGVPVIRCAFGVLAGVVEQ